MTDEEIIEFIKDRISTPIEKWDSCELFLSVAFKGMNVNYIFDKHPFNRKTGCSKPKRYTREEQIKELETHCKRLLKFWEKKEKENA